jgi:hypothetical protein
VAACNRIGDGYLLNGTGPGWGDLVWNRGVTIAAGETRTFDVSETVPQASLNRGKVVAACDFGYSEVDIDNHVDDRGEVTRGLAGTEVGSPPKRGTRRSRRCRSTPRTARGDGQRPGPQWTGALSGQRTPRRDTGKSK